MARLRGYRNLSFCIKGTFSSAAPDAGFGQLRREESCSAGPHGLVPRGTE